MQVVLPSAVPERHKGLSGKICWEEVFLLHTSEQSCSKNPSGAIPAVSCLPLAINHAAGTCPVVRHHASLLQMCYKACTCSKLLGLPPGVAAECRLWKAFSPMHEAFTNTTLFACRWYCWTQSSIRGP